MTSSSWRRFVRPRQPSRWSCQIPSLRWGESQYASDVIHRFRDIVTIKISSHCFADHCEVICYSDITIKLLHMATYPCELFFFSILPGHSEHSAEMFLSVHSQTGYKVNIGLRLSSVYPYLCVSFHLAVRTNPPKSPNYATCQCFFYRKCPGYNKVDI